MKLSKDVSVDPASTINLKIINNCYYAKTSHVYIEKRIMIFL
jgi:hypothetical protein